MMRLRAWVLMKLLRVLLLKRLLMLLLIRLLILRVLLILLLLILRVLLTLRVLLILCLEVFNARKTNVADVNGIVQGLITCKMMWRTTNQLFCRWRVCKRVGV